VVGVARELGSSSHRALPRRPSPAPATGETRSTPRSPGGSRSRRIGGTVRLRDLATRDRLRL